LLVFIPVRKHPHPCRRQRQQQQEEEEEQEEFHRHSRGHHYNHTQQDDCSLLLVVALVHSRLDYGNSVLVGVPVYLMRRLQSLLNAAARLIFHLRRSDHISDALVCLHWLHVPERIEFKIAVLTYKVLCGAAPRYLGPLNRTADMADRRSLRSSSATNRLVVPSYRLSSVGSRAFPVAAAKIWNALPDNLVSATSLQTFRRHLKTFLFSDPSCSTSVDLAVVFT